MADRTVNRNLAGRPVVYVETTVVSYLTAQPSRDVVTVERQQLTREWWEDRRQAFRVVSSQLAVQEASKGDRQAARRRLDEI